MFTTEPFVSAKYEHSGQGDHPRVKVKVGNSKRESLTALVDTGCSVGLLISADSAKELDLGEKVNSDPTPILAADGHVLGADVYLSHIEISTETCPAEVYVLDTSNILRSVPSTVEPLLGRALIDRFKVTFDGQAKRLSFFK